MSHDPFFASEADELAALAAVGAWAGPADTTSAAAAAVQEALVERSEGREIVTSIAGLRRELASLEQDAADRGTDAA